MADIYFEREIEGNGDRAYTRIDFNRAVVGNRWLERTWSGFFGTTTSLVQKANDSEWVTAENPEFSLTIDGEIVEPIALGEIDVSEGCSDLGASLLIRKSRPGLDVTISCTALHEVPALLRGVTVTNTGAEAVQLDSVSSEMLEWEEKSGQLVAHRFFKEVAEPYECGAEDPCVAMLHNNQGMLMGRLGEGEIHLNRPNPHQSHVVCSCAQTLEPRETWTAPATYIISCGSDPLADYLKHEPELVTQLKLAERREEEIQEALRADE